MRGLLARLLLVVVVAMVPAVAFHAYTVSQAVQARHELAREESMRLLNRVVAEQMRIVEGAEQTLDGIAAALEVIDGQPGLCGRLLAEVVRQAPRYLNAGVAGLDGRLVCSARPAGVGLDLSGRDYFADALRTGHLVLGDYIVGQLTGEPSFVIAKPYRDAGGAVAGVLEVSLSLAWLGRQLAALPLPDGSIARVSDRNGTVLARRPNGDYAGRRIPDANRFSLEGDRPGVATADDWHGGSVVLAYAPPGHERNRFAISVSLEPEAAFGAAEAADRTGMALLAAGGALALLLTALLGNRLIRRPAAELLQGARQWHAGALDFRIGLHRDRTEFGRIAAAMDGMAAALQAREAALAELNRDLERRVRAEVAAREAAQARAAQTERTQALGQLAGGIAHDFNNVLQAMTGALRIIARQPNDRDGVRRMAALALGAAERGTSITRRLLTIGQRGDASAESLDMADVLHELADVLRLTLGSRVAVRLDVAPGLARLRADRGQLESVLINLASNGRDAMPDGGELVLSAACETVGPLSCRGPGGTDGPTRLLPGRYVRLAVADCGSGMDAATLARVREPFFTTKKAGDGTGLGLTLAHSFAEQSGGALAIESRPGQGTTVTLWLPEAGADAAAAAAVAPAAPPGDRPARRRILLVDDDPDILEILTRELTDAGYDVLPASSGAEALARAAAERPDGVVTDHAMPGMDGLALVRDLQARDPGLPAILLTGYAGEDAALALDGAFSGAFSLLRKPVTQKQLTDRLQAVLAACAAIRQ